MFFSFGIYVDIDGVFRQVPLKMALKTRPIKSKLGCETRNLIFKTQCNRCNLQYIGETKRRLKDRFNEHRRTIDNPNNKSKPTTAAEHFLSSPNHTANDIQLISIEENLFEPRRAREAFLIQKGRTIDPDGLNIREETYYFPFFFNCVILFYRMLILNSGITILMLHKNTYQCTIPIVPEEGWFGLPK